MANMGNWVPVALSTSIEPATSAGAVVDGAEIVVWRDNKGVAHVWEDRCPHRGMRLSFGFVRGDHIACLYHGWQYDTAGQCRHIPAHPELDVPKTIKVQTYSAEERHGLIWTCPGEKADAATIPDSGAATPVRSIYADSTLDRASALLRQAVLPQPSGGRTLPAVLEPAGRFCWTLSAGETRLFIAGQSIASDRIALHILILGDAGAAEKKSIARWAEGLRIGLEDAACVDAMAEFA